MITVAQLLASLGVGGANLTLKLPGDRYARGATIVGELEVRGGEIPQSIQSLTVKLNELVPQGKTTNVLNHTKLVLANSWQIEPHSLHTFPLSFSIPEAARIYSGPPNTVAGWQVSAEADILWAINPRALTPLSVLPHEEVTAVQEAVKSLGFQVTKLYIEFARALTPDTIVQFYTAPALYAEQLDGASLHLWLSGDHLKGRFILNWREVTLADHLKAMVGGDREELSLEMPRHELLRTNGAAHPQGAVPYLKAALEGAQVYPDSEARHLVRAASAPADAATLLRPAAGVPEASTEMLLRPMDETCEPGHTETAKNSRRSSG